MKASNTFTFTILHWLRQAFLFAALAVPGVVLCQDAHFSQFNEATWWRNPSLAGLFKGDLKVNMQHRSQWGSLATPFQTTNLNIEAKTPVGRGDDFLSYGGTIVHDKAGEAALTTTNFLPGISYSKSLGQNRTSYLSLGFVGGMVQRRFDISKIRTNAGFDGSPDEVFNNNNVTYWNGSVGLSYNTALGQHPDDNLYFGVAYHNFNRPRTSFYKDASIELAGRYTASLGVKYALTDYSYINFESEYSVQGDFKRFIAGGMYAVKIGDEFDNPDYIFQFGGYIRWNDAFIPAVRIDYKQWKINMTYDGNISGLRTASQMRGGFEISIGWQGFLSQYSLVKDAPRQPIY